MAMLAGCGDTLLVGSGSMLGESSSEYMFGSESPDGEMHA